MKKLALLFVLAAACGDDSGNAKPDAPTVHEVDAAVDAPNGPDCFTGTPMTNDEIINACVDQSVTRIMKNPMLPLLLPDGSLPPLP